MYAAGPLFRTLIAEELPIGSEKRGRSEENFMDASTYDLGLVALARLKEIWAIDEYRCLNKHRGFDWWPNQFRVSVEASEAVLKDGMESFRLRVATQVTTGGEQDIPGSGFKGVQIDGLARFAPTYAFYSVPKKCPQEKHLLGSHGQMKFVTTVYINPSVSNWMARFLAGMAILQPIAAQNQAASVAEIIEGMVDESAPPGSSQNLPPDELMDLVNSNYRPAGSSESRWRGSAEFEQFARHYGRTEHLYGNASETGLTVETPIGDDTALIQLSSSVAHPVLGNGLACRLMLPFHFGEVQSRHLAEQLNFAEANEHTFFPLIGSWCSFPVRPELTSVAFNSFIPNLLFNQEMVPNLVLWLMARVEWVKRRFFQELKDMRLPDILEQRLESMEGHGPRRDN